MAKKVVKKYEDKFKVLPEHVEKVPSNRKIDYAGETFTIRKNNRKSLYAFIEYEKARREQMENAAKDKASWIDGEFGPRPSYDRYDYYVDMLKFILIGDLSKINVEELDMNEAEEIALSFLPESMRLAATLIGF